MNRCQRDEDTAVSSRLDAYVIVPHPNFRYYLQAGGGVDYAPVEGFANRHGWKLKRSC